MGAILRPQGKFHSTKRLSKISSHAFHRAILIYDVMANKMAEENLFLNSPVLNAAIWKTF